MIVILSGVTVTVSTSRQNIGESICHAISPHKKRKRKEKEKEKKERNLIASLCCLLNGIERLLSLFLQLGFRISICLFLSQIALFSFLSHTPPYIGEVIRPDGNPQHLYLDFTVPEAAEWWIGVPLQVVMAANADGVFFDGTSGMDFTGVGISRERSQAINSAAFAAVKEYRQRAQKLLANHVVIGNGLSEYSYPPDHGMFSLAFLDGVCIEHFGAFEGVDDRNGSILPANLLLWAQLTAQAVSLNKTVLIKTWIGPETTPIDGMGPTWPSAHTPALNRTHVGIAKAAKENLVFPHSLFLCIVQPEVYLSYAWWYDLMQGYVPCPETPEGCDVPDNFYPALLKKVGDPLSVGKWSAYVCQREFLHASVYVDLGNISSARIVWK